MGERSYGIAMTPKMYSMMSDKLYTDRIGSVVREVCSNAWDAQKMQSIATGNPMEPFKVTLPTDLEPHFIVEDTGPGMPDEVAQDLYSTLGLSTKENTNDQIGAFGLGSKSPFAVSDTFTVENTHKGVTHFYLCFKAENGMPSLLKTGERNEGRADGVKVLIPAPGAKYNEYKQALNRQLIVMEPKPIICNIEAFEFADAKISLRNQAGYILENPGDFALRTRSLYARMGMVMYPVDYGQMREVQYGLFTKLAAASLVLEFPIGALDPLPSREGLTYDDRTKKNIVTLYKEFEKDYKERLKKEVEANTLPLEAWRHIKRLDRSLGINMMHEDIYVQGYPINDSQIPNVFPAFYHEWEAEVTKYKEGIVEPGDYYYDDNLPADKQTHKKQIAYQEKVVQKGDLPQFFVERYSSYERKTNKTPKPEHWRNIDFSTLNDIDSSGTYKFLLWDEETPKYRIPRLKKWLDKMHYRETYFVVKVDSRFPGSKTDFSEFIQSFENVHPGLTEKEGLFTKFTEIVYERDKKMRDKDEEKEIEGIAVQKPSSTYENYLKWSFLEEMVKGVENEDGEMEDGAWKDNIFYVNAFRQNLSDYGDLDLKVLARMATQNDWAMLIVRKVGQVHHPKLATLGIPEFKDFINAKMSSFAPDDDYRRHNSANIIQANCPNGWFRWNVKEQVTLIHNLLLKENVWVHPFFTMHQEIARLASDYEADWDDPGHQLLTSLKANNLTKFFADGPWTKMVEIDMSSEFDAVEKSFMEMYPAMSVLISKNGYRDDVADPIKIQYIKDYNAFHGRVAETIDYTEVFESSIINKGNQE
jgi:hypothetical protein